MKKFSYIKSELQPDHWVVGGITNSFPKEILRPDGQWTDVVPAYEGQNHGFETYACTTFGTLSCVQMLQKVKYGQTVNLSNRFMGIVGGVDPKRGGGDPHVVSEALRHAGAIAEADLPFNDTIKTVEEFYSFKGNTEEACRGAGKSWTWAWSYLHTWVFNGFVGNKKELLKEYLQYSPLGVTVYGWTKNDKGLYIKPKGERDNHWTQLIGYKEGEYWIIDDSYLEDGSPIKHLEWDYDFGCAKAYSLTLNKVWHAPWYTSILSALTNLYGKIKELF